MIRGVIFDLGSTLLYWEGDGAEIDAQASAALVAGLNSQGIAVGEDFLPLFQGERKKGWQLAEESEMEHTVEEALTNALSQLGHVSLDGICARAVEQFFSVGELYQRPYPGAIETLRQLKQRGLRVGLISNADDDGLVQRACVRLGFAPYLDPLLSSAGMKWRKPNRAIFDYVAKQWQLPPREIAMVGDAPLYDILGAHRAGMRGILIDRNEGHWWQQIPERYANDPAIQPDATAHDLMEILDVINRL